MAIISASASGFWRNSANVDDLPGPSPGSAKYQSLIIGSDAVRQNGSIKFFYRAQPDEVENQDRWTLFACFPRDAGRNSHTCIT